MLYKHFEFVVEQMTDEQADSLLEFIERYVQANRLSMSGGFISTADADYTECEEEPASIPIISVSESSLL